MTAQQLKNAILQEAIQGRLVPQDPNDEPASVLLDKIRKEKARLVKDGKLKKKDLEEKPISEDEIPFEIPESWEWCRMSSYLDVRDGTHDSPKYYSEGVPFVTSKNLSDGKIDFSTCRLISIEDHRKFSARSYVEDGDILFAMIGSIGNPVIVKKDREFSIKNVALFKRYDSHLVNEKYLYHYLSFIQYEFKKIASGGVQSFLGLSSFRDWVFPLPPLAEQKRIVAKIEELLPKVEEYGKAQDKLNKLNEELPERLKKSILQEAIEGRLVPQDPNDEPASALLAKIREEKKQLVKEGKLKKKDLEEKPISEDEIPFEIPDSWEWVRFSQLYWQLTDGTHSTPKYKEEGIPFLSVKDMSSGKISFSNTKYISAEEHSLLSQRCHPQKGDLLLSKVGTTGIPLIIDTDREFSIFVSLALIKYFPNLIDSNFLLYLINSPLVQLQVKDNTRGVGNKNWVLTAIGNTIMVLPPLAEQKRIVEKIEQLLVEIDKLKK